jgi:hypothetical protein
MTARLRRWLEETGDWRERHAIPDEEGRFSVVLRPPLDRIFVAGSGIALVGWVWLLATGWDRAPGVLGIAFVIGNVLVLVTPGVELVARAAARRVRNGRG